jgi:hypothetical protein
MELKVVERIMLGTMLAPIAADVVTLRIVRNLQTELSFSDEESEGLEFKQEGKRTTWNLDVPQIKEFEFKPAALRIIVEQLKRASASKTLTLQQLDLYDKFCPEEEEEV